MDLATTYTIKAKVTGQESLNGLNKGLGKVKESSNKAATAFNKLKSAGNSLMGVLGSIGATAAVTGFLKAGIDMQRTQKTLKILTEEYGEHKQALEFVDVAAERFGIGQQKATRGVADLFGRLRPMGITLEQIQDTFLGLNNAALKMNLSTADTEGAMLQLSQALGSGVLQGDEFRSIMERLPAIGQAVADVMGVNVSELKQLSSDGELTTEVIIKAMQKLKQMDVPPPDSFKLYNKAMENFSTVLGTKLLPAFTPFVNFLTSILEKFSTLPGPLQTIIAGATALGAGLLIIAPVLGGIVIGITSLGLAISAAVGFFAPLLAGAAIPAAIIGLGVLIFKFRDQIGSALKAVGQFFVDTFMIIPNFIGGIINKGIDMAKNAFNRLPNIVQQAIKAALAPFHLLIKTLKAALNLIARVRGARKQEQAEGAAAAAAAATSTAATSTAATSAASSVPALPYTYGYAERGQDMSFENIGDYRGFTSSAGISEFPSNRSSFTNRPKSKTPNIDIKTGNVVQFNNENYVTTQDLQNAVQSGVSQTLNYIQADGITHYL